MNDSVSPVCDLPERLPDFRALHQYFTAALLLDLSKVPQVQQEAGLSKLCNLQQAYRALLLPYDLTPHDLQTVIASFTSALLRVSQSLKGPASRALLQQALDAAEDVHSLIENHQRCKELLALARYALESGNAQVGSSATSSHHCPGLSCGVGQQPSDWSETLQQFMPKCLEDSGATAAQASSSTLQGSSAYVDGELPLVSWF